MQKDLDQGRREGVGAPQNPFPISFMLDSKSTVSLQRGIQRLGFDIIKYQT